MGRCADEVIRLPSSVPLRWCGASIIGALRDGDDPNEVGTPCARPASGGDHHDVILFHESFRARPGDTCF